MRRSPGPEWVPGPASDRRRRSTVRFAIVFVGLVAILSGLSALPAAMRWVHTPLSRILVRLAGGVLSLGGATLAADVHLGFRGFVMTIADACDGVLPAIIYVAAVLAFPGRWRDRILGVGIGLPVIFLINLVRVIALMMMGAVWPEGFHVVHIYVWQGLVVVLALALWAVWAERCLAGGVAAGG